MTLKADITNSERRNAACPQLWLLRYGLGLGSGESSRALRVGNLVHEGLDVLHVEGITGALHRMSAMRDEMLERNDTAEHVVDVFAPSRVDVDEVHASYAEAAALVERYVERYSQTCQFDEVVWTERTLRAPARTPSGKRSPVTRIAGKVDMLARINGRHWIVERKTTALDLGSWYHQHRYDPQASTYAWLVRETMGIEVAGVCYDLILRDVPKPASSLLRTKPDKSFPCGRLRKPSGGVPHTTASEWLKAVFDTHGPLDPKLRLLCAREQLQAVVQSTAAPDKVEWYVDAFDALIHRQDGHYFRREFEPMTSEQIDRAGAELYHAATNIRRWRNRTAEHRQQILDASAGGFDPDGGGVVAGIVAHQALVELSAEFPRNPAFCRRYNRLCSYANACETLSLDAVRSLRVRDEVHSELDPETPNTRSSK